MIRPRAPPEGTAAPSRNAALSLPGTGRATTRAPARAARPLAGELGDGAVLRAAELDDAAARAAAPTRLGDVRRDLPGIDRATCQSLGTGSTGPRCAMPSSSSTKPWNWVARSSVTGSPGSDQHLFGGELGAVVAVRDPVDADDRHVHQVPQAPTVHRLDQPPGAGDVDRPRIAPGIAGRVHDHLRLADGGRQADARREVAAHSPGTRAPPRQLPHGVPGRLQRVGQELAEPAGGTGDQNVHADSLPGPQPASTRPARITVRGGACRASRSTVRSRRAPAGRPGRPRAARSRAVRAPGRPTW